MGSSFCRTSSTYQVQAVLDAESVGVALERKDAWSIHVTDEVASTNDAVLDLPVGSETVGTVLFAERQTAGRGRRGNVWFGGPPESNLLFSCRVRPAWPLRDWGRLTHLTALALKRALEGYPPASPLVKWPNDLYLGDRKVSGILAETKMQGGGEASAVIGVGVNVNVQQDELPEEIRDLATSLREVTGTWIDRVGFAAGILDRLSDILSSPAEAFAKQLAELKKAHYLLGKPVRARLGVKIIEGTAIDLGSEGELVLDVGGGKRCLLASTDEVRVRR